jgi:integrase
MLQCGTAKREQKTAQEGRSRFRGSERNCYQQMSSTKKLKGIYLRGNIFWFTHGTGEGRLQVSLETSDEAEAIQKAQAILDNPELNPCNGFLTELNRYGTAKVADGTWTKNSHTSKTAILKMFGEDMGFKDLPDIKTEEIQKWFANQKKRVAASAHSYMLTVRAFFNWAVTENLIRASPAAGVKLGKEIKTARIKFCTFAQRDKIFRAAADDDDLLFICYCGFYAGMRKDEIIEARPEWFDLEHDLIHIEKTATFSVKNKKARSVPLHPAFRRFLERYLKTGTFMLKPDVVKGEGLYRYDFRKKFAALTRSVGLAWVTPHVMRHTFASLLATQGVSLFKIAKWLGDTLATTEKHYAHLVPEDDTIGLLTTPVARTGTRLTPTEIAALQKKAMDYELALKELVPADRLEAYWVGVRNLKDPEEKLPNAA